MWQYYAYNELYHSGSKGMKWGRRRYQNNDGTWTPLGLSRRRSESGESDPAEKKRFGIFKKKSKGSLSESVKPVETQEEKKARLSKSSNAEEIFKNKDLFSTPELKERIDRINTEKTLAQLIPTKKSAMDKATDKINAALKVGKTINDVYAFTNTPVMKQIKKDLGLDTTPKKTINKRWTQNLDNLSSDELQALAARAKQESSVKEYINRLRGNS